MKSFESQILEESLTSGERSGIDNPIAVLRDMNNNQEFDDDEVFFYTKDHLGSIRELIGLDGKLKQRQRYTAYGITTREKNTDQMDRLIDHAYGFTGRELDSETGLYFYRSRYYSPVMNRFVSEDVIGYDSGKTNLYGYVSLSPIVSADPYGLFDWREVHIPQWLVDSSAGFGSALSFGLTDVFNDYTGASSQYSQCSSAYNAGYYTAIGASAGRLAYAGLAKAGSMLLSSGRAANQFRNTLKIVFRGGL